MIRLLGSPPEALRGDVVPRTPRVAPVTEIGAHLLYWTQQLEQWSPDEGTMRVDTVPILVKRLLDLTDLHAQYQHLRHTAEPLTRGERAEFQLGCSSALGVSALLMHPPVQELTQYSPSVTESNGQPTPLCFDPGSRDLRWHVLLGEETDLVPGYIASDAPAAWYEGDGVFVRVDQPADPTGDFRESYQEFHLNEFEPNRFVTVTPVAISDSFQALL